VPRRIDAGELVAALGGLLVIVALFLNWFGIGGGDGLPFGAAATGWEAFESLDLVLTALALVAIAVAASSFGAGWPLSPRVLLPVGAVLVIIVAIQLAEPPPLLGELDLEEGAWLALAGAVLVLLGGILRTSSIAITVSTRGRDVRQRVSAVDRREAATGPAAPPPAEAPRRRSLLDDDEPRPTPAGGSGALADTQATQPFRPVDEGK
jgi:hypothetical protein